MLGGLDLLRSVGQCAEGKRRVGLFNRQRSRRLTAGVVLLQRELTGAHMQAAVLRDEGRFNVRHLLMAAKDAALAAIRVGLARKAGPERAGHGGKRLEFYAEAGQLRCIGHAMIDGLDQQRALRLHGVGQLGLSAGHGGHAVGIAHLHTVGGFLQDRKTEVLQVDIRRQPGRRFLREAAAAVIVGGGAPERRARGAPEPLAAVDGQRRRPGLARGKENFKPVAPDAEVAVALGHGQRAGLAGSLCFGRVAVRPGGGCGVAGIVGGAAGGGVVPVAHVLHGGFLGTVGVDNAVAAEVVIGVAVRKVAAVAQHAAAKRVGVPERLIHVVPDEAALVLVELVGQAHIALHAAQRVAHIVHIFAENEGLLRVGFEILADFPRLGVHPAFHVADGVERAAVEHTLIMHEASRVVVVEELRHGENILACVALIAAGPDQDGGVVLVAFKHAAGAVHDAVLPLGQAAGHVPARLHRAELLPAAMAFEVRLVDHVDAVPVTQVVPQALVGVVAGAHGVDVVLFEHGHGGVHIIGADGAAPVGVPLVAVDAVEHDTFPVQAHDAVYHLKAAEADVVGHDLLQNAVGIAQGQYSVVEHRRSMAPRLDALDLNRIARGGALVDGVALGVGHDEGSRCAVGLAVQLDEGRQQAGGVVGGKVGLEPDVVDVDLGLCVQVDRAEDAREAEEVLILDPGGAAALVDLDAEAVVLILNIRCQVKFRRGEAVLGIADELAVAPQVHGLLHALKADADALAAQGLVQIKLFDIAAHGVIVPIDLRRAQAAAAIPRVEGVGVLQLTVALQLDVPGHADRTEAGQVGVRLPEIRRAGGRVGAPRKAPCAVQ